MKLGIKPVYAPESLGGLLLGPVAYTFEIDASEVTEPKPLLSVAEAAKIIGVCRTTANEMVRDGTIPAKQVRGRKKIRRDDLEAFLKRGTAAKPRRRAA